MPLEMLVRGTAEKSGFDDLIGGIAVHNQGSRLERCDCRCMKCSKDAPERNPIYAADMQKRSPQRLGFAQSPTSVRQRARSSRRFHRSSLD